MPGKQNEILHSVKTLEEPKGKPGKCRTGKEVDTDNKRLSPARLGCSRLPIPGGMCLLRRVVADPPASCLCSQLTKVIHVGLGLGGLLAAIRTRIKERRAAPVLQRKSLWSPGDLFVFIVVYLFDFALFWLCFSLYLLFQI